MTRLSVNLNKVALLRNARPLGIPSVTGCAIIAIEAGAHGITVHPRPDQRHIRADDVRDLAQLLAGRKHIEFNIEGNPFHGLVDIAKRVKPHQCTLVPDDPNQFTSDHGWDLQRDGARVKPIIAEMKALGICVSLFMDAEPRNMVLAKAAGADCIELYTEPYAQAHGTPMQASVLAMFSSAALAAQHAGLEVNAGHDLNLHNLRDFLAAVPHVKEVSIGHALIGDALEMGYGDTVRAYQACLQA